ncbi:unnamed protein product [Owenia fusiformis]|uniref:Uncharacterized protein n=1 Tax=Owenia fusiformis TaxID=6347 RepID=A0A8J1UJH4_OWEFU|nr:unnamed protein product [Owenia fusiformis]
MLLLTFVCLTYLTTANAVTLGTAAASDWGYWTASILKVDAVNSSIYTHTCGGVLLNTTGYGNSDRLWILSSARCFAENQITADWRVEVGRRHILDDDPSTVQLKPVSRIIRYPTYDINDYQVNDIALVKMGSRVSLNSRVGVAFLPSRTNENYVGRDCYLSGWGKLNSFDEDTAPEFILGGRAMQIADTFTISNADCSSQYPAIVNTMVCAMRSETEYPSPCGERDYGSPLICNAGSVNSPIYRAAGISTGQWPGQNCGDNSLTPIPLFTRVAPFITWIQDTVTNN